MSCSRSLRLLYPSHGRSNPPTTGPRFHTVPHCGGSSGQLGSSTGTPPVYRIRIIDYWHNSQSETVSLFQIRNFIQGFYYLIMHYLYLAFVLRLRYTLESLHNFFNDKVLQLFLNRKNLPNTKLIIKKKYSQKTVQVPVGGRAWAGWCWTCLLRRLT